MREGCPGWNDRRLNLYSLMRIRVPERGDAKLSFTIGAIDWSHAGEKPIEGVSGQVLYEETQQFGHKSIYFEPDLSKIPSLVAQIAEPEDLIFILGAGSINKIIPELIKELGGQ